MKIKALLNAATLGNTKSLKPMIGWAILEYAFRGVPYGVLLMVIWELFIPLRNPGTQMDIQKLFLLCGALFISLILLLLVSRISYNKAYINSYNICAQGRLTIADHIRKLSMGFFNSRDPGSIGAYLINDYAQIEFLLSHIVPQMAGALAMPLVLLIFLAVLHWQMALISALVIPAAIPMVYISRKIITHFGKKHQSARMETASRMLEYLQGMKFIRAFNLTGTKFDRMEKTFLNLKSLSIKLEAGAGPTVILASFILHGGLTLIILFGLTFLFSGSLSLPFYIMFLVIGSRVYEPLLQVLLFMGELNYHQLSVERIEDLRKTPILISEDPVEKPDRVNIEFRQVTFRYHNTDVLKEISVTIPEKSLVAIVGPSGSGKTTMTRLIARFWDVSGGAILMGGNDIRRYEPDDLLASISMVFQDVYLFNDSVIDNIRIGKKDASREKVIEAAKKARCHDFIVKLPNGYESIIGEGGSTLSSGEKQRISIARAILKNAPVLLLDEATASLDPENELYIQEAINDLVKDKTVVVIAHRLNTIVKADKIIVLDNGELVEQGTHDMLMRLNGLYSRMWNEQQKTRKWKF